jgi:hypothetical protein
MIEKNMNAARDQVAKYINVIIKIIYNQNPEILATKKHCHKLETTLICVPLSYVILTLL